MARTVFTGGLIYQNGAVRKNSLFTLDDNGIVSISEHCPREGAGALFLCRDDTVIKADGCIAVPGFTDVHVHFREPGFEYKETIHTGSLAARAGGYSCVCTMPNLKPSPCDEAGLKTQLDIIKRDAVVEVRPYGTITKDSAGKELTDFAKLKELGAVAFSDDGKGVQSEEMMEKAMRSAKENGVIIAAHCEDNTLLNGGYIHDGEYAKIHGHRGICSESEWGQIKRDLMLAAKTGASYHVCHISTKESVKLIREAKRAGVDVTCETGPHYLTMTDMDLQEEGRFKMNPPIRSEADRDALLEGIADGTIDVIATDHAPHSAEEKSRGLEKSAMGIVGLETSFPVLYTELVKKNIISLEKLIELMAINPVKRFPVSGGCLEEGKTGNFAVIDIEHGYAVDPDEFYSKGRATPFAGKTVEGRILYNCFGGKLWKR